MSTSPVAATPLPALGAVLFVIGFAAAAALDMLFGPIAVLLIAAIIVGVGLYLKREWLAYAGGLIVCAGLSYDIALDAVQTGEIFSSLFALLTVGAVGCIAMISAEKMRAGV
jgi:hypothetical protein